MTTVKVENTTEGALVLPNGPTIDKKSARPVADWEKKESNLVVQAWIRAGAIVISSLEGDEAAEPAVTGEEGAGNAQTTADAGNSKGESEAVALKTDAEFRALTNDELRDFIEAKGGTVKSTWNKDELVKQALELQA